MIKLTRRKGFNFFRSYYDVFNELADKDKLEFIKALLDKQFIGVEPENLKGQAKFAWISQMHSIDEQVKGYESSTGDKLTALTTPLAGGKNRPLAGGTDTPPPTSISISERERVSKRGVVLPFDSEDFEKNWQLWKDYKKAEHKFNYKTPQSEQAALKKLNNLADGIEADAIAIIHESMANGWKGFFKIEKNNKDENRSNSIRNVALRIASED